MLERSPCSAISSRVSPPRKHEGPGRRRLSALQGRAIWLLPFVVAAITLVSMLPSAHAQPVASAPASVPADLSSAELRRLTWRILGQSELPQARVEAAVTLLQWFSNDGVQALLEILETQNNESAKLAICQAITQTQTDNSVFIPPLMAFLDHKEQALREAAAAALAGFHDPTVTARLKELERQLRDKNYVSLSKELYALLPTDEVRVARLQRWLRSADPLQRVIALEITRDKMSTGTRPATDVLAMIRQMLYDKDGRVRQLVVAVLRDLRQPEDAALVRALLAGERLPEVREEIYRALGYLGDAQSIPACIQGLNDAVDTVAAQAASALGRLAIKRPDTQPANTDAAVAALLARARLPMENPMLREQLVEAMAQIADPRFLPVLVERARGDETLPAARQAALLGLGSIGDATHADLVIDRLVSDTDPGVREIAAQALGKLGNKAQHLEVLRSRLDAKVESSPAVQNSAWAAYLQLFTRVLTPAECDAALKNWTTSDPLTLGRRIDLLTALDKETGKTEADPQRRIRIREDLGDTFLSAGRPADAAGAFAGALDLVAPAEQDTARRLATKLMEAHLRTPAHEKAISMIIEAASPELQTALASYLLDYVRQLAASNPVTASTLLDLVSRLAGDKLAPGWIARFAEVRRSIAASSQPASSQPQAAGS